VDGALRSTRAAPARAALLQGRVALRIAADVPPVIALTPGLDLIVTNILEAILGRLDAALRRGLLDDYSLWVREQQAAPPVAAAPAVAAGPVVAPAGAAPPALEGAERRAGV
jgi:hypothetical protein